MPIRIDTDLPARAILEEENVFVMDIDRAVTQDIRPLRIAILNLMPNKLDTELHLLRSLSNTPLQIDITFLKTASYEPHMCRNPTWRNFMCILMRCGTKNLTE